VAQIGACIGREFGYELLSAVWLQGDRLLQQALDQLAQSELVSHRGTPPDAVYTFKHALVQDVAYDSLLRSRRAELHARIARVLEKNFPETTQSEPELIAHHYSAAGEPGLAAPLWLRAGQRALANMALPEAIAHLQRGLAELQKFKNPSEREPIELELRVALGAAWMGLGGWFNPNVPLALEPAWDLAKKHGRRELMAPMIWGLAMHLATTGRLEDSLTWVQKVVDPADVSMSDDMWIVLEMAKCVCLFWHGDLLAAKQSVDSVLAAYQPEKHGHIATLTNHDPKTVMAIYRANLLWLLGYPDQALEATRELDRIAHERGHFFDQGFAWTLGGWAYVYCGMPDEFEKFIEKAYRVGVEQSMPFFSHVQVPIHRGYVFFEQQKYREAVDVSRGGVENWFSLGGGIAMPHTLAYWAAAHARLGEVDQGLEVVERGIEQACRPGWLERAHLAELLRVKGTLLELKGDIPAAETAYLASLDWAQTQQAKSLELRAATSYARLMRLQNRRKEALKMLKPLYGWFTEGFNTRDLKEAKALLDELR
jgi:tetratricopeptide (TPR) repeat protein